MAARQMKIFPGKRWFSIDIRLQLNPMMGEKLVPALVSIGFRLQLNQMVHEKLVQPLSSIAQKLIPPRWIEKTGPGTFFHLTEA